MVMASLIEALYLPELERQERRDAVEVAQQWWRPFSYSLAHELVDERDGSVFGAVFKWDHRNLLGRCGREDSRPTGAPSAVISFRGTLLCAPTIRRDMEDELRLLTARACAAPVRRRASSENVCLCGHSLSTGFARQIGGMLMASRQRQHPQQAQRQASLEFYLFNAPSLEFYL